MSHTKLKAAEELIAKLEWGGCDYCADYCPLCNMHRTVTVWDEDFVQSEIAGEHKPDCPVALYKKTEY